MQENKHYTIEPEFKDVTKDEFNRFLESYPRPLISDFFMDSVSYNDFNLADRWPWSMIAIKNLWYYCEENEETTYRIAVNYIDMFNSKTGYMEDSANALENI